MCWYGNQVVQALLQYWRDLLKEKNNFLQGPQKKAVILTGEAMKEMQKQAKQIREERRAQVSRSCCDSVYYVASIKVWYWIRIIEFH